MLPEHRTSTTSYGRSWDQNRFNNIGCSFPRYQKGLRKKPINFIFTPSMISMKIRNTEIKFFLMTFETDFQCFHPLFHYRVVFAIFHWNFYWNRWTKTNRIFEEKIIKASEVLTLINDCPEMLVRNSKEEKENPNQISISMVASFLIWWNEIRLFNCVVKFKIEWISICVFFFIFNLQMFKHKQINSIIKKFSSSAFYLVTLAIHSIE